MANTLKLDRQYGQEWASKASDLTTITIILNDHALTKYTVCTSRDGETEESQAETMWNSLVKALKIKDCPYPHPAPKVREYKVGKNVVKVIHERKKRSQVYLNDKRIQEYFGEYSVAHGEEMFERLVHGLNL